MFPAPTDQFLRFRCLRASCKATLPACASVTTQSSFEREGSRSSFSEALQGHAFVQKCGGVHEVEKQQLVTCEKRSQHLSQWIWLRQEGVVPVRREQFAVLATHTRIRHACRKRSDVGRGKEPVG